MDNKPTPVGQKVIKITPEQVAATQPINNQPVVPQQPPVTVTPQTVSSSPKTTLISPTEVLQTADAFKPKQNVISPEEVLQTSDAFKPKQTVISPEEVSQTSDAFQPKQTAISKADVLNTTGESNTQPSNSLSQKDASSALNNASVKLEENQPTLQQQNMASPAEQKTQMPSHTSAQQPKQPSKTISADEVKKESVKYEEKDKETLKKEKKEMLKKLKKPKRKEKSDYVNALLMLAICLLLTIIITPPILRKVMPKQEPIELNKNKDAIILSCTAINEQEQYKINSRTKYIKDKATQNFITYTKLTQEELGAELKTHPKTNINVSSEINFFNSIRGLEINTTENKSTVLIYDYVIERNTSNFKFIKYLQEKSSQESFYKSQGYSCEEIKS